MPKYLFIILGPTGIGKTDLTIDIAKYLNTDIISCDSRQFYKELSIGTAAPSKTQLSEVKHHFIHHISIHDYYNVSHFEQDTLKLLKELFKEKDIALMTGGSMMYIDVICNGIDDIPDIDEEIRNNYIKRLKNGEIDSLRFELKQVDPEYYKQVDLKNGKRIIRALEVFAQTGNPYSKYRTAPKKNRDFKIIKIGLNRDRQELYERINKRVDIMMQNGLLEEAKQYYKYKELNALNTVGYKEIYDYLDGNITLEKAVELIKRNSRRYAKRQLSWFKRDETIKWFSPDKKEKIITFIKNQINKD